MTRFCIDRKVLGTEHHLICSGPDSFAWVDDRPADVWHFTGHVKPDSPVCLDTALMLKGVKLALTLPQRFSRMFEQLAPTRDRDSIPWAWAIPPAVHRPFLRNVVNSVAEAIDPITLDYLSVTWVHGTRLLESLQPARVDRLRVKAHLANEESDSVKAALSSFAPADDGFAPAVEYDRLATATGRLTVKHGPQILTVRKDCRNVLESVYGQDGAICMLDFAGLEPRIVLAEAGVPCSDADLYTAVSRDVFGGKASRSAVKTSIISAMYGASRRMVADMLGSDGPEVDAFIARVSEHFKFRDLGERLFIEHETHGFIRNAYGRPLLLAGRDDPTPSLMVSHYVQSSGVDVALCGFERVVQRLKQIAPASRPLFVLHDALIFDARREDLQAVREITGVCVERYGIDFPLKFEEIA